jgi:hypothetical protein
MVFVFGTVDGCLKDLRRDLAAPEPIRAIGVPIFARFSSIFCAFHP